MSTVSSPKKSIIIAGPNGAGKTTFARSFLLPRFINADLIAAAMRWNNFQRHYKQAVDDWALYDNAAAEPVMLEWGENQ